MEIQRLTVEEGARLRAIRLRVLHDAPDAFGTTLEESLLWPPEVWSEQLAGIACFAAVVDNSDVGLVRGVPDGKAEDTARLHSLWVSPEARGTGVGEVLIDTVIEWAHSKGFDRLRLGVSDDNAWAIALYARKGFEPNGEVGTLPPPREHLRTHVRILELK
jgi:GNAT superfamily N-acetyltransferase